MNPIRHAFKNVSKKVKFVSTLKTIIEIMFPLLKFFLNW